MCALRSTQSEFKKMPALTKPSIRFALEAEKKSKSNKWNLGTAIFKNRRSSKSVV